MIAPWYMLSLEKIMKRFIIWSKLVVGKIDISENSVQLWYNKIVIDIKKNDVNGSIVYEITDLK